MKDLLLLDLSSLTPELKAEAKSVLEWAQAELKKDTFPHDNYREFHELVVVSFGGEICGFIFRLPGPDHNACRMSKCIYFLKIRLIRKVVTLSEKEKKQADSLDNLIPMVYARYWFTAPLASSAAMSDLDFMIAVHGMRMVNPKIAWKLLQSFHCHNCYLALQLVILALTDWDLEDEN